MVKVLKVLNDIQHGDVYYVCIYITDFNLKKFSNDL